MVGARLAAVALGLFSSKQLLVLQHADDFDHGLRVVPRLGEILRPQAIGFELVFPAVAGRPGLRERLQQRGTRLVVHARDQNGSQDRAHAGRRRGTLLAHPVACGDMADLMADHACQLCLGIEIGHDPARDVDVTAGQRKGIHVRAVDHREMPFQVWPVTLSGQVLADGVDIGLE